MLSVTTSRLWHFQKTYIHTFLLFSPDIARFCQFIAYHNFSYLLAFSQLIYYLARKFSKEAIEKLYRNYNNERRNLINKLRDNS